MTTSTDASGDVASGPAPGKHGKNAFAFVFVTVLLDMMGFGLIIPVMPELLMELTSLSSEEVVIWGGLLTTTFGLTNFLAGPTLGGLSDRYGRRPILLASIATLVIDYLIMGFATTLVALFIGRALAGISSATFSTANAYVADTTSPDERGRAFGILGAAFGIGFILGPILGGFLGEISTRAPFFAAAVLASINFLYGVFVLPESLKPENRRAFDAKRSNPFGAFQHFRKLPHISWFLIMLALYSLAHSVYPQTWSYHGVIRYGWSSGEIGFSLTLVGVVDAFVQAVLLGVILKKFGPERTLFVGLMICMLAFVAFAFAGYGWMMLMIIPIAGLGGVVRPSLMTMMSNLTPDNAQGELQGATAAMGSLAMVISPLVMTYTLYWFVSEDAAIYFPGAAFLLAAILIALSVIPFMIGIRNQRTAN